MRAIISVIGQDKVGILAKVTNACAEHKINVVDVTQSVLREFFAMIMLVDIDGLNCDFGAFVDQMNALGTASGLCISTMHEDIFNTMHHI